METKEENKIETTTNKGKKEKKYVQSYKEFNSKRWLLCAVTAGMLLIGIISLFFPYVKMNFLLTGEKGSTNAFKCAFSDMYYEILDGKIESMQLVAWFHVLGIVCGIAFFIYAILKQNEKFVEITSKVLLLICLIIAVSEWDLGTNVALYVQEQGDIYGTGEITYVTAQSSSYLYFIFLVIFEIGYFALDKYLPETFDLKNLTAKKDTVDSADSMLKYRQLYENGVITEAEYEKKKEEFLKSIGEK